MKYLIAYTGVIFVLGIWAYPDVLAWVKGEVPKQEFKGGFHGGVKGEPGLKAPPADKWMPWKKEQS